METHVSKSGCFPDKSQVPAIAVAQGQNGPPRSKQALPIMRKWVTRASRIYFYDFCSELALCDLRSTRKNNRARQPCQPGKPMHFHPIEHCRHSRNPRTRLRHYRRHRVPHTPLFITSEWDRLRESPSRAYRIEEICRWLSDSSFSLPAVFGQPCARHVSNRLYLSFEEPLSPIDDEPGFRASQLPLVRVARDWSARPRLFLPVGVRRRSTWNALLTVYACDAFFPFAGRVLPGLEFGKRLCPSSARATSRRHVAPWTARWQWPAPAIERHAFLREHDASLHGQTRRPAYWPIFLALHRDELFPLHPFLALARSVPPQIRSRKEVCAIDQLALTKRVRR